MSPQNEPDISEALRCARNALSNHPGGLFTDIDGTISEIVDMPGSARVVAAARAALRDLARKLDTVAVVSGRAARDARRMVRVAGLTYVGNHGLEVQRGRAWKVHPAAEPFVQPLQQCLTELGRAFQLAGIRAEDKTVTGAVHYRLANDPSRAREVILETLQRVPACRGLRATDGRMVINLLPPVDVTKGTAVRDLSEERGLQGVVYIGDDVTDLDAFDALAELRSRGIATAVIAVASPEAPSELITRADATVPSVQAVTRLLQALGAE